MNKKVLALVLALVIALGTFGTAFAAEDNRYTSAEHKVQWLIDNKVVEGRKVNENPEDNDLALDKNITRAEVTKLLVYTLELQNLADALKGTVLAFPDVELNHWANGWVNVATTREIGKERIRLVVGYPDGLFRPENNVTYAELAVMLVRIAKDDLTLKDEAFANAPENWASQWMRWAQEEGILDGLKVLDSDAPATRKDAFIMIYNTMRAIGKTGFNNVKFGDVMGIVSKVQAGIIQLNQDPKMEYKVTYSSRVTNGTSWRSIADNSYEPGALVRLIANKDGEIEYIIELGNPTDGAIGDRWFDVADKTAETLDFNRLGREENSKPSTTKGYAFFTNQYFNEITVDGVKASINSDTRFFVADKANNALKEIKSLTDVFKLYIRDYREIHKVYMGYDSYHGRNEAKVIVFGQVEKYMGGTATRRITGYYNSAYKIETEDTKGVRYTYDFANTNYFPRAKYVDYMDVVKLYLNGDKYSQSNWGKLGETNGYKVVIDYSEDPVFEVTDLSLGDREITLYDKFGDEKQYYINDRSASIFLEGQLRKGAHVQIALTDDNQEIDVISVVNKDLKGHLPNGVRKGDAHGYVVSLPTTADWDKSLYQVTVAEEVHNGRNYNVRAYVVHADSKDLDAVKDAYAKGYEIVFNVSKYYGNTPIMFNVERKLSSGIQDYGANLILGENVIATINGKTYEGKQALTVAGGSVVTLGHKDLGAVPFVKYVVENAVLNGNVFTMPKYGTVKVTAEYGKAAEAKITNAGECEVEIIAVNGTMLPEQNVIRLAQGDEATEYTPYGATKAVKFVAGDVITVKGICGGPCEFKGVKLTSNCNSSSFGPGCNELNYQTGMCGKCANGTKCEACTAQVTLNGCENKLEAIYETNKEAEGWIDLTLRRNCISCAPYEFIGQKTTQATGATGNPYFEAVINGENGKVVLTEAGKKAGVVITSIEPQDGQNKIGNITVTNAEKFEFSFHVVAGSCTDPDSVCEGLITVKVNYTIPGPCDACPGR